MLGCTFSIHADLVNPVTPVWTCCPGFEPFSSFWWSYNVTDVIGFVIFVKLIVWSKHCKIIQCDRVKGSCMLYKAGRCPKSPLQYYPNKPLAGNLQHRENLSGLLPSGLQVCLWRRGGEETWLVHCFPDSDSDKPLLPYDKRKIKKSLGE